MKVSSLNCIVSVKDVRTAVAFYGPALSFYLFFFNFYFYFILLYSTALVLPYIDMNPPRVYMSSQSWTPLPPPTPYHLSGSSPCTSPKHPVSCIEHRLRGWAREMIWGGRWEGGSGLGTHVHPCLIHFNVWQNQYSIVKQNKVKIKIKKKKQFEFFSQLFWDINDA